MWRQKTKVHHRLHKIPTPVPILSQLNPLNPTANLPKIHPDPTHALVFQVVSFLWAFAPKTLHSSLFAHACYMTRQPHFP
jgi:hypothetical protein